MKSLFLFIFLSLQILLVPFAESLEQERLHEFFVEYNSSEKNYGDKIVYAIEKGYVDIASFLVLRGEIIKEYKEGHPSDPSKINDEGRQLWDYHHKHPLITAIRKGYNDLATEMIQMGVNISKAEEYNEVYRKDKTTKNKYMYIERKPAFYVAMSEGKENLSLIHAFLEAGLNINTDIIEFQGVTHITEFQGVPHNATQKLATLPLHLAIEYKKLEVARLLLDSGANTELTFLCDPYSGAKSFFGGTPLYLAVEANYKEGVELLLGYGADPLGLHGYKTPLDLAIQRGYDDIVDLLISSL